MCMFAEDGFGLPKKIVELPVQLIGVCKEILTNRDTIIKGLKVMGSYQVRQ